MILSQKPTFRTLYRFLAANLLLTLGLCYPYILFKVAYQNGWSLFFVHAALVSNSLVLYLVLGILFSIPVLFFSNRVLPAVLILVSALHILNFTDVAIYRIFKFHINSMVINLVFTEGAGDVLHLGIATTATFFFVVAVLILLEILLLRYLKKKDAKPFSGRTILITVIFGFLVIVTDKITYAVSDLYNIREVTRYTGIFPLYQPLTIKRFARRHFGIEPLYEETIKADMSGSGLLYPKEKLTRKDQDTYPNILWIIPDAWRFDMLNPEVTPNIYKFSKQCTVFDNHYSGGNATRFGVFSLFYGIYGYYWHPFLGENQGSVFIDALLDTGYDIKIIASASCSNPEFRKTAFVKIPDSITDNLNAGTVSGKDILLTQTFIRWMEARDTSRPFFSFLFYDAPHGPYSYPDEFDIDKPSNRNPNYLTIGKKDADTLRNSYKNAIRFNDHEIGKVLSYMNEKGYLENTIVLITGDHGEEFNESGFLGHNSAFSDYQAKVPLVLYRPGKPAETIRCMTSHVDVVPTFMEWLGYTTPQAAYSQGRSLFDGKGHDYVVCASWGECAIIDADHSICFSLETHNPGFFEIRDNKYRIIEDYKPIFKAKRPRVMAVLEGIQEFNQ